MLTVFKGQRQCTCEEASLTQQISKHCSTRVLYKARVRYGENAMLRLTRYSFAIDETSPSKFEEEVDYEIMSYVDSE